MTPFLARHAVAAIFSIAVFAPVTWWAMDREPPFVRHAGEITPALPAPGEYIHVKWSFTSKRNCPPNTPRNVTRTIIDATGKRHVYDPDLGIYGTTPNSPTSLLQEMQLPIGMEPGLARYRSSVCFACNPVHHFWPVCVDRPELAFEVRKP